MRSNSIWVTILASVESETTLRQFWVVRRERRAFDVVGAELEQIVELLREILAAHRPPQARSLTQVLLPRHEERAIRGSASHAGDDSTIGAGHGIDQSRIVTLNAFSVCCTLHSHPE
jgi:hypothetical protein